MFNFEIVRVISVVCLLCWVVIAQAEVDPTKPYSFKQPASSSSVSSYKLRSILLSPNRKVAIINNKVVSEGDNVGRAKVVRINEKSVTLAIADKELQVSLMVSNIKHKK